MSFRASDPEPVDSGELELVEGIVSELHIDMSHENLLAKVQQRYRGEAVVTGSVAVIGGMFVQAAAAAALAMYDGEDTQSFICFIDGHVVCGQFAGAEWLREGNRVRAVVSRHGEVFVARAILDRMQGLVWIGHAWGAKAEAKANWSIALGIYLFQLICMSFISIWWNGLSAKALDVVVVSALGGGALCFGVAMWANRDMRTLADPSTEMFRLLGFRNPEEVNLNNYQIAPVATRDHLREVRVDPVAVRPAVLDMGEYRKRNVFDYKRAVSDGKLFVTDR